MAAETQTAEDRSDRRPSRMEPLLPGLLFALIAALATRYWQGYEFDTDEGINLSKAALVAAGYHPYADIWNDQPPLLTYALAIVHTQFGGSVAWARTLILFAASMLLVAVFAMLRASHGRGAAWFGVLVLAGTTVFLELSVSVMVGLPALSVMMWALCFALSPGAHRGLNLVVAGALFAVSLQIKFFTFLAAPALLLAALWPDSRTPFRPVRDVALLTAGFGAALAALVLALGVPLMGQLVSPHVESDLRDTYSFWASLGEVREDLGENVWVLVLAVLGVAYCVRTRERTGLALTILSVVALIAFCLHTPVNYHHALVYLLPLAGLAGIGAERVRLRLAAYAPHWRYLAGAAGLGLVLAGGIAAFPQIADGDPHGPRVAAALAARQAPGEWAVSDRPMDTYRSGMLMPPPLAVYSKKRLRAGNLTAATLIDAIDRYAPGVVIFRRFPPPPGVIEHLDRRYEPFDPGVEGAFFARRGTLAD
ncbi:MAG: glycosyltransferase family 39 protein [Pseudomonadota bacterium]